MAIGLDFPEGFPSVDPGSIAISQLPIDEYAEQLAQLLPQGRAWTRERGTVLRTLLRGLAVELARGGDRVGDYLTEIYPGTTTELITDWERALGLPDACAGLPGNFAARRDAILAKLRNVGGQTPAYFIAVAAALGFTITIQEHIPARCGTAECTDPMDGGDWPLAWTVIAPEETFRPALCGTAVCTDPILAFGNAALECLLQEIKPAHTVLTFSYVPVAARDHLVFIYLDDPYHLKGWEDTLGWDPEDGTAATQSRFPQTPNVDELLASGVRCTRVLNTPVCSPGRATIMTGVEPRRHGLGTVPKAENDGVVQEFGEPGFEYPVLGDLLSNAGVRAAWIGKIHLSKGSETEGGQGFGIFSRLGQWEHKVAIRANLNQEPFPAGFNAATAGYNAFVVERNGIEEDVVGDYNTDFLFREARDWMNQLNDGDRGFLYLPLNFAHAPFDAPPAGTVATAEYLADPQTAWSRQLAMHEAFDHYLGQFLAGLDDEVRERTTICIVADNGPDGPVVQSGRDVHGKRYGANYDRLIDSAEARFKGAVFRHGAEVQMLWSGPGVLKPGSTSTSLVGLGDLHATIAEYFGAAPGQTDGVSQLAALELGAQGPRREAFTELFLPNGDPSAYQTSAPWDEGGIGYSVGDEVELLGIVYAANTAHTSSSGNGPPGGVWDRVRERSIGWYLFIDDHPGGPVFNGWFKLVRRFGFADRLYRKWDVFEAPADVDELIELNTAGAYASVYQRVADALETYLGAIIGGALCLPVTDEDGNLGTLPTDLAGDIPLQGESGTFGALLTPVDEVLVLDESANLGALPLVDCASISDGDCVDVTDEAGVSGVLPVNSNGAIPLVNAQGVESEVPVTTGTLAVLGETGIPGTLTLIVCGPFPRCASITDEDDVAGVLAARFDDALEVLDEDGNVGALASVAGVAVVFDEAGVPGELDLVDCGTFGDEVSITNAAGVLGTLDLDAEGKAPVQDSSGADGALQVTLGTIVLEDEAGAFGELVLT